MPTKIIIISIATMAMAGCGCFRVCPTLPPPPKIDPMPNLCYPLLRPDVDPVDKVLGCYINDIIGLEQAAKTRDKALDAYRQ